MNQAPRFYYEEILPHIKSDLKLRSQNCREELGRDGEYWLFTPESKDIAGFCMERLEKRYGGLYNITYEQPELETSDDEWAIVLRKK